MKNNTETLAESWALFKANVTKGWAKEQVSAAHDMYMVGACDLGRLVFGIMSDKTANPLASAAKLKKIEAELEGYKLQIATSSIKKAARDPEAKDAIEILKKRSAE